LHKRNPWTPGQYFLDAMNDMLKELVGRRVAIWSGGSQGYKDEGTVEKADGIWIRLREKNEVKYFSVHGVRLIKVLDEQPL
jgi:hypothetical protein